MCVGPLSCERLDIAENECDVLLRTVNESQAKPQELVMTAASPGIIALTLKNNHYPSYEDYVFALADEMRQEYKLIVSRGLVLQLDCPDLAMERHMSYQDEPLDVFQDLVRLHIRAINHALQNIPREQVRLHVCWGNSEGPHHYDVSLEDILPCYTKPELGRW